VAERAMVFRWDATKSAIAAANRAYEDVHKAPKQADDIAEANFRSLGPEGGGTLYSRSSMQARRSTSITDSGSWDNRIHDK
jgi:hypothetical protein